MTTKGLSKKQMIISININNTEAIISQANKYISKINRLLKDVKFDVLADFICFDNKGVVITTNKVAAISDLNIVKKYLKKLNNVDSNDIMSLWLPQLVMGRWNTNNFYFSFLLFFWFYIDFIFIFILFWTMKRHVTPQSHDKSHDVMS